MMFNRLTTWWNKDKIELEQRLVSVEKRIEEERIAKETAEQELEETKQEVSMYRARDEADEAKRSGTEPWIEIKSADFDTVKGIHIELDWNVAFVQYLKDSGFKGRDDEVIVQKWLAFLYEDLIGRLEQKVVDESDKPRVNDFE